MIITQANKDYQQKIAQEKVEHQKAYSDILAFQLRLKEDIATKYGTMTDQERRMNHKDLTVIYITNI